MPSPDPSPGAHFGPTRWTWVEAAGGADSERAREALAELCRAYWYPLYAFVRRFGVEAGEAEDVVQDFFARLIEKRDLASVVRGRGRFRSFLRVAIRNHLANLRDRERAGKRGGGRVHLAVDVRTAAERYEREPELAGEDRATPDRLFDRAWALELMAAAVRGLEAEYEASARGPTFRALRERLVPGTGGPPLSALARELGTTEGALRVASHRLRARFRERLREEIARTVASPDEVEAEIDELFRALGS